MEEIRKPEITKKTSTPTKPPLNICTLGKAWNTKTANTATALKPSISGRQPIEDFLTEEFLFTINQTALFYS